MRDSTVCYGFFIFIFIVADPHCAGSKKNITLKNIVLNQVLNLNLPTSMATRKLKYTGIRVRTSQSLNLQVHVVVKMENFVVLQ